MAAAREKGLLVGAYLLGRPGDPIAQADALVDLANRTGVTFLALDIENLDPALSMTLPNAVQFIERVHEKTGRYPAFYTNWSTYNHISSTYGPNSVFAKTPLWVARFRNMLGNQNRTVWQDYSFWQFSSEINCMPGRTCAYRVPGTQTDMDVNIFNGTEEQLRALFRLDSRRTAIRGRTGSAGCARLLHPAWVGGGWRRREDGARRLAATGPAPSLGGRRRFSSGAPPLALNGLGAHFVHRSNFHRLPPRYGRGMKSQITVHQGSLADEFEARAATLRRVAERDAGSGRALGAASDRRRI